MALSRLYYIMPCRLLKVHVLDGVLFVYSLSYGLAMVVCGGLILFTSIPSSLLLRDYTLYPLSTGLIDPFLLNVTV